jgi:hypothetical protein
MVPSCIIRTPELYNKDARVCVEPHALQGQDPQGSPVIPKGSVCVCFGCSGRWLVSFMAGTYAFAEVQAAWSCQFPTAWSPCAIGAWRILGPTHPTPEYVVLFTLAVVPCCSMMQGDGVPGPTW